jgi:hypothetical protein
VSEETDHNPAIEPANNQLRSDRIWPLVQRYQLLSGEEVPYNQHMNDILTDVMHFCLRYGIDFEKALSTAQRHFDTEIEEEKILFEGTNIVKWEYSALDNLEGETQWYFACAMVSSHRSHGLFQECESNYEVEEMLRVAEVIREPNTTDSETCCMWVYFQTEQEGKDFIDRLNDYIEKRMKEAQE